jgi:hypothetical protein
MSLCDKLAFWTNRDSAQMDRLFRRSGLYRIKWDEVHYASGETYGQHTIAEAIAKTVSGYTGSGRPSALLTNAKTEAGLDAFTVSEPVFDDPRQEIDYLRRALAAERAKNFGLVRDNDRLREENRNLRKEKETLEIVHARQWRVISNQKLKGVGHTAVKIHAEYMSALEHAKGEDGWVPLVIGSDYGVAAGIGKSAKRAGGDLQKLVDWDLVDKRTEKIQLTDGPNAGQLRTRMFMRFKDPDTFLDALAALDPLQPTWGGKRVPRCRDHPHAAVVRTTAYMCQECGQILEEVREQVFAPDGQDVPSGVGESEPVEWATDLAATDATGAEAPEGTRCPSGSVLLSTVDIRTLERQLDQSGPSPPQDAPPPGSTSNPLYDLALRLFPGSYFLEDAPA